MRRALAVLVIALVSIASAQDARPTLRIGLAGLPDGLDPAVNINIGANGFRTLYSVFDRLIQRDFLVGGLKPGLATAWHWVDSTTLELELRHGVKFHDGSDFGSEDVVYTFERIIDPASDFVTARGTLKNVAKIEAVDEHTVRIHTKSPDPVLEQVLTMQETAILPAGAYATPEEASRFNQLPVGTGPYRVLSFSAGDQLTLAAFDSYWEGLPTAKEVVFRVIPETAARITALVNGEVDIITAVPPDQLDTIRRFSGVSVREAVLDNIHLLRYNTNNPALSDKLLRQAMNLAIDRQLLSDALWGGAAEVPRSHQFRAFGDMYDANRPVDVYDPQRARELLADSNYSGQTIYLNAHPTWYVNFMSAAEAIVEMWRSIGINAQVRVVSSPAELFGLAADDPMAMVNTWSNSMRYADPAGGLWANWSPSGPPQASGYWNAPEEFNRLGAEALQTTDRDVRRADYWRMLDIWEDEAPGTTLYYSVEFYGIRDGVNWQPYSDFYIDLRPSNLSFE